MVLLFKFAAGASDFSFLPEACLASYAMNIGCCFLWRKAAEYKTDHSPPSSVEVESGAFTFTQSTLCF
jgi:hypothetical protein